MTADDQSTTSPDEHGRALPRVSRTVSAPVEAVWAVLEDGWLYATWVVGAARVRAVDHDWPQAGSQLHHSVGVWPVMLSDSTVSTTCEPQRQLVLTARAWPAGQARVDIELASAGPGACTVTIAEDATSGPGRLVPMPVRQLLILARNREALRRLALLAEGRHTALAAGFPARPLGR